MANHYLTAGVLAVSTLLSAAAQADPADAIVAWKQFLTTNTGKDRGKYVEAISTPAAQELAKRWSALRGYDAPTMLKAANLPPELKPGLVIDASNVDAPWLKDVIAPGLADRVKASDWFRFKQLLLVPTSTYYMPKGTLEQTEAAKKAGIVFNATPEGNLLTPDGKFALSTQGALPFVNPKNGLELTWTFVAHGIANDNLNFHPMTMEACNAENKLERTYVAELWWQKMHGRKDIPPYGDAPGMDGVVEGGAIFFLSPRDVRGLSGVRKRFADAKVGDDFKVYVPSLKRTRYLSSTDGQSPIVAGLELIWDDWRAYWVKTDINAFSYDITKEGWELGMPHGSHFYEVVDRDGKCDVANMEVELRPIWRLEIKDKTGKYIYSNRILGLDKEFYYTVSNTFLDARGNLFRMWYDSRDWVPETGLAQWRHVPIWNPISKRTTWLTMDARWDDLQNNPTVATFDVDQLRDFQ